MTGAVGSRGGDVAGGGVTQEEGSPTTPDRYLYRIPEAMLLLSMSRSVIYEQIRAGRLRSVTQGRARLIPASAIRDYVALLLAEAEEGHEQSA